MALHVDDEELLSLQSPNSRAPPMRIPVPPPSSSSSRTARSRAQSELHGGDGRTEQRIGQYNIKRTLGEGSFGKVKLATHRVSGQEVALKIISRKKLVSRDMAGRVEREISYLQLLRHPHIIKLFTVITTPGEIIMVLEYAGGELFDYLVKYGKLAEDMARRFFQQIVCAVEYCHRHKIVHRDLKPENLLLDSRLNVKIADFGLSNIMTDGNFLKTSCGSPNYAAPEVISGKLYAGPEVDVWSCGIILYVLLVGKLPFDDEFIPALFRKINSGNYHCPSWMSSGPRNLISRMLKVNPMQRITIQEIRDDPWFKEGLEDYLKPPVEEFMETGIDPNKPINKTNLAPDKPPEVQAEMFDQVVSKLGKTMGYAKGDVQEALAKDEPNAIKDAYLIVRENQIMRSIPNAASLTTKENEQPYLATSPPAYDPTMPASPSSPPVMSPLASIIGQQREIMLPPPPPPATTRKPSVPKNEEAPSAAGSIDKQDAYTSKVSILASSMPHYHKLFLEQQRKEKERLYQQQHQHGGDADDARPLDINWQHGQSSNELGQAERSPEEQKQLARALKPHSRSTLDLQRIVSQPIEADSDTTKPEKKRSPKWQFGIRSRNMPHEAMHCVYRALIALGAEWEIPESVDDSPHHTPRTYPVNIKGGTRLDHSMDQSRAGSPEASRKAQPTREYFDSRHQGFTANNDSYGQPEKRLVEKPNGDGYETDDADIDPTVMPGDYIPKDPWCIRVRWRKDGMYPPGTTMHPSSAHSSRADLAGAGTTAAAATSTSSSANGAASSGQVPAMTSSSSPSASGPHPSQPPKGPSAESSAYVYMDVQLYSIEPGPDRHQVYLVDFKCAGYETLVEKVVGESEKELVGSGYRVKDKDVTSPQPFLDLANRLVIQLASGNTG